MTTRTQTSIDLVTSSLIITYNSKDEKFVMKTGRTVITEISKKTLLEKFNLPETTPIDDLLMHGMASVLEDLLKFTLKTVFS